MNMRVVDLKIEDIAFGGKGVGREQGKAIFVPYTIEAELVSAEIVREKNNLPRRSWWKLRKAPRIASHRSAPILAAAADARTSTSTTNISSRLNGTRCATFSSESAS